MFIIEVPYFNLDQIYNSKQAPRWIKLKENNYIVIHRDKAVVVEQKRQRLILKCTEEEFYSTWFDYFDLRTDYFKLNAQIKKLGGKFKIVANRGSGIHILNQDLFETLVYCELVPLVGFDKASELMLRIATNYGIHHKNSMGDAGKVDWYEWPNPEILLEKLNKEKKSSGIVKSMLRHICENIVDRVFDVEESSNELFRLLGMHKNEFPIVGIEEVLERNFDCLAEEFEEWYLYGFENKGLAYMCILHHVINPPKKIKEAISNGVSR